MPWRIWPFALIALIATSADVRGAAPTAISGDFAGVIDIGGGRKLYLECKGAGSPVVILEAGLRNRADIWSVKPDTGAAVFPEVAASARVCAYDRPVTTLATDQPQRRSANAADSEGRCYRPARTASGRRHPFAYVLVGHSTGGLISRLYASGYPMEVVGLVLVDAIPEGLQTAMTPEQWKVYNRLLLVDPPKVLAVY